MSFHRAARRCGCIAAWLLAAVAAAAANAAGAEPHEVSFAWHPGVADRFSDAAATGDLTARLYLPKGETGPLPFVIFLHGCGGLKPDLVEHWSTRLNRQGVGVLMVDSFAARGVSSVCGEGRAWYGRRIDDVRAAHAWLGAQGFVRPDRIALMGQSHGGGVALLAMGEQATASLFVGAVALYPPCALGSGPPQFGKPVVVLMGDEDTWTPASHCLRLQAAQRQPENFEVIVYPGARHLFDNPVPYRLALQRYPVGEHAASRDKARERVAGFVEAVLLKP